MITYKQILRLRKFVKIDPHAVEQYRARISKNLEEDTIKQRLVNAYLRGTLLVISKRRHFKQVMRYLEDATYYKYGDLVVVVHESGSRYDEWNKTILTCYKYTNSKFDPSYIN